MINNQGKFNLFRDKYPVFRFKKYTIFENEEEILLTYNFVIDNLTRI